MCAQTFAALLGLAAGCLPVAPGPLLAPADPARETAWHPPPPPLADVARVAPVEARSDWGAGSPPPKAGGRDRPAAGEPMPGNPMPGMDRPGMDMPGMRGRP